MNFLYLYKIRNITRQCMVLLLICCYNFETFASGNPKSLLKLIKAKNFKDAQRKCEQFQGKLATPFDEEKVEAIVSTITTNQGRK